MAYSFFWTNEAVENLEEILDYLHYKWTIKEVNNFKLKLSKFIELIQSNPNLFPSSDKLPHLRKAVMSKQTSLFYQVVDSEIYLISIFINKKDLSRLK